MDSWLSRDELARMRIRAHGARVPHTAIRVLSRHWKAGPVLLTIPQEWHLRPWLLAMPSSGVC